jgi:hypothetical protein
MEEVTRVELPTPEVWERVELARKLYSESVAVIGGEAVMVEAIVMLCAKEEGWDEMESAMVLALMLGNATPENLHETVIPF